MTTLKRALALIAAPLVLAASACTTAGDQPAPVVTVSAPVTHTPEPTATVAVDDPDDEQREPTEPTSSPAPPEDRPATGATVTPDIYMADVQGDELWVVVYVPNIFESGGECTVTVESGSTTRTQENLSEADASSTACGMFTFPLSQLSSGTAVVTAHYLSADYSGESQPLEVRIP